MATANDLLTEVYRRTRDPDRVATPVSLGLQLLSDAQKVVNIYTKSVVTTQSFALSLDRLLYKITDEIPACARLEGVRFNNRDLREIPWTTLWQIDPHWFRTLETTPKHWSRIGRDLFVIYPGPSEAVTVNLVYTPVLDDLDQLGDVVSIRDEFFPLLLDLTEALFLFRLRLFGNADASPFDIVLARLEAMVGIGKPK